MTDIGGLFCVVLCLYACLRALQAQANRSVLAWLALAALSDALGGTVRQIAWLGVLVMFPCTIWLLRRRPHVPGFGILLYCISLFMVFVSLHWFRQQPYSVPEQLFGGQFNLHEINHRSVQLLSLFLSGSLFLLPVLVAFVPEISLRNRRIAASLAGAASLGIAASALLAHYRPMSFDLLVAPFVGDYVTPYGIVPVFRIKGALPPNLPFSTRLVITIVVVLTLFCFCAFLVTHRRPYRLEETPASLYPPVSWNHLLTLLVPFTLAYLVLLMPRALRGDLHDRYLLPLMFIGLIMLVRLYQDRVKSNLPLVSSVFVLLFAFYAVAETHDEFSMYRAQQAAIGELRAAGTPDIAIDGGFEHNAMAQIDRFGYVDDPRIRIPATDYIAQASSFPADCQPTWTPLTPAIVPGYALSFDPKSCGGLSRFAPVIYREWLTLRTVPVYIVHTIKPVRGQR